MVHSRERSDGPWYYTLEAGKKIEREVWSWRGARYHLAVSAPGGFLREYAGQLAAVARPEAWIIYDPVSVAVEVVLSNTGSGRSATFQVSDNAYGRSASSHTVAAGRPQKVRVAVAASYGWYDLLVTTDTDATYLRRMAGHLENGLASRTAPVLSAAR